MVESASIQIEKDIDVTFVLVGDSSTSFNEWQKRNKNIKCRFTEINDSPWPFPTLLRFRYLNMVIDQVSSDYIMYLDADMEFISNFTLNQLSFADLSGIVLVRHPGYFRTANRAMIKQFGLLNFLKFKIRDLRLLGKYFGIGTWERNKNSRAYVPPLHRKFYVCGGTWWGENEKIKQLSIELARDINHDLSRNVIATFHDESHLNRWASSNPFKLVGPEFCFDPRFPFPEDITPIIRAVDKNLNGHWERLGTSMGIK